VRLILRLPMLTMRDDFVELMSMLRLECTVGDDGMVSLSLSLSRSLSLSLSLCVCVCVCVCARACVCV
jgi:hypothetical protein